MTVTPDDLVGLAADAVRIVTEGRRSEYGAPERAFHAIALFWTAYLRATGRDVTITAADVSPMMRMMKEGRLTQNNAHRDSHIDLIGYTLTGYEVAKGDKP